MKRTTLLAVTGGAVVVLATTGAALGVAASGPGGAPRDASSRSASLVADATTASSSPSHRASAGERISAKRAVEIALDRVGGGQVREIEAEHEDGRPVWEVELIAGGVEVDVDRQTGAVVEIERKAPEVRDRHDGKPGDRGDDHHGDNSGPGSGDDDHHGDNSGPGSGGDDGDNSGRDHPEDD